MDDLSTTGMRSGNKARLCEYPFPHMHLELYTTASSKYYQENHPVIFTVCLQMSRGKILISMCRDGSDAESLNWELENDRHIIVGFPGNTRELAKAIFMRMILKQ